MHHDDDPPAVLYHYTCRDSLPGIRADGTLIPNRHPLLGESLVWLTDLDVPDRRGLGLTAEHLLTCDRTAICITVAGGPAMLRWPVWARRAAIPGLVRTMLEGGGGLPAHWWVSPVPVAVQDIHIRDQAVAS